MQVVATPHYEAAGCEGPTYRSFILVRADTKARDVGELRGTRLAVNGRDSWSGYRVWSRILSEFPEVEEHFGHIAITGSHRESVRAVRKGRADVCAVDCVSHALLGDRAPGELAGTRILGRSPLQPALPFITGAVTTQRELARIREGLFAALADSELSEARNALRLAGASVLTEADYRRAFGA